jgi:DNA-binding NarL/FixJ family response regulator
VVGEPPVRVVLISDIRLYREGLTEVLAAKGPIDVVGTCAGAATGVQMAKDLHPDVVVIDAALEDGLDTLQALLAGEPATRVVMLTVGGADREIIGWAEAGAMGYVTRDGSLDDLVVAVIGAAQGNAICPPTVSAALLRRVIEVSRQRFAHQSSARLTGREAEILQLIDEGLSNKAIAHHLGISFATVKNHVHNILEKLDAENRLEAAARSRSV